MSNFSNVLNARSQGLKTTAHFLSWYICITFTRGKNNEKSETAVRTGHIFFYARGQDHNQTRC